MEMQELLNILSAWRWPILVFVLVLILVPVFKRELAELIGRAKHKTTLSKGVEIDSANEVSNANAQAVDIEREVAASGMPLSPPRRATVVSDFFPQPQTGQPAAIFDGIGGVVRGKRFPIEKAHVRIGRDSDNDVAILGDEFVSAHHASLHYQGGSLLLSDDGSRNGTFLNEKRVTGTAVRRGDRIRIGNAVFQVSESPSSQMEKKPMGKEQSEVVG